MAHGREVAWLIGCNRLRLSLGPLQLAHHVVTVLVPATMPAPRAMYGRLALILHRPKVATHVAYPLRAICHLYSHLASSPLPALRRRVYIPAKAKMTQRVPPTKGMPALPSPGVLKEGFENQYLVETPIDFHSATSARFQPCRTQQRPGRVWKIAASVALPQR